MGGGKLRGWEVEGWGLWGGGGLKREGKKLHVVEVVEFVMFSLGGFKLNNDDNDGRCPINPSLRFHYQPTFETALPIVA